MTKGCQRANTHHNRITFHAKIKWSLRNTKIWNRLSRSFGDVWSLHDFIHFLLSVVVGCSPWQSFNISSMQPRHLMSKSFGRNWWNLNSFECLLSCFPQSMVCGPDLPGSSRLFLQFWDSRLLCKALRGFAGTSSWQSWAAMTQTAIPKCEITAFLTKKLPDQLHESMNILKTKERKLMKTLEVFLWLLFFDGNHNTKSSAPKMKAANATSATFFVCQET